MPQENSVSFKDLKGHNQEVKLDVGLYRKAADEGVSLSQYVNQAFPTGHAKASTFDQMAASAGLFLSSDNSFGINPPTMADVMSGNAVLNAGAITRDGGANIGTPASRILYPEVVLQSIFSELNESDDPFLKSIDAMTRITSNVTTSRIEQPIIDVTGPKGVASQPISQLAAPPNMVKITTADKSYRMPTNAIGLEISDEALQASTIDLVSLALTANARQQAILRAEEDLSNLINGDVDSNVEAVVAHNASTLDSGIPAVKMTQKAYVKFLYENYRTLGIDWLVMDIDTALELENRTGKPVVTGDNPTSARIDTIFTVENLTLQPPKVLLVDTSVVGADTIIGIDSRYALRKVENVSASYEAIENYVLRRAKGLRFDQSSMLTKIYPEAFKGLVIGA